MMLSQFLLRVGAIALASCALAACTPKVDLMAAVPESEANEVLAALQNAGVQAEKIPGKEGMVGVSLDASKVGRAVDLLRAKGLPRERFAGMGQVFRKEGLISSPLEERARYLYALSQELGSTLSQIDGVIIARVHVVLPERGSVGDPVQPSSAAVFIKHQEGYNIDALQPLIRRLVNNSIPALAPEKISIVLVASQRAPATATAAQAAAQAAQPAEQGGSAAIAWAAGSALLVLLLAGAGVGGFWWYRRRRAATTAAPRVAPA